MEKDKMLGMMKLCQIKFGLNCAEIGLVLVVLP